MPSVNKVMIMGNLTRDPELRHTSSGKSVTSFGLAMNQKYKQDDEWKENTCFADISVWGKQGENCTKYLKKGSLAFVEGRLNSAEWQTQSGEKRQKLEVVAQNVQFLDGKPNSEQETQETREDDFMF